MFYNWDRIEQITDEYRNKTEAALRSDTMFFPHGLGFIAKTAEENGLSVIAAKQLIRTRVGLQSFLQYTARSIHTEGRLEAGGFLACLPRDVAAEYVPVGDALDRIPDVVAVLHVEHVYLGFRTWIFDHPDGEWVRLSSTFTKFPTCLPADVYGPTNVGRA